MAASKGSTHETVPGLGAELPLKNRPRIVKPTQLVQLPASSDLEDADRPAVTVALGRRDAVGLPRVSASGLDPRMLLARRSGLDVLEIRHQAWVRWPPSELGAGVRAGGGLIGREDGAEGSVGVFRYRFDWQPQPSANDCRDVTHLVAFIGDSVPGGAGRRVSSAKRNRTAASSACTAGQRWVPSPG
jgi:hypothetical protein